MTHEVVSPLVLTRKQVREVDRRAIAEYGMTGLVLMENAGRNAADLVRHLGINGPVAICCGKGNNAGDGLVIARHLENRGVEVRVLLAMPASSLMGDAATNFGILRRAGSQIVEPSDDISRSWNDELLRADWIVDALLGTGTIGTIRGPFVSAIRAINAAQKKVLAIDLPSGLDCDTGTALGDCVVAQHTATFVAHKPGFQFASARQYTGEIHVLDIGVPRLLLRELNESSRGLSGPSE